MGFLDRLTTIVVTATLTSAAWLVAGGTFLENARGMSGGLVGGPAPVASSKRELTADQTAKAPPSSRERASFDREDVFPPKLAAGELTIPVTGIQAGQLTDTFTQSRDGGARLHEAIDIMAARGTPVVSAADGKVEKLFQSAAGGLTAYVRSKDGRTIFYYAHLDTYQPGLKEGQIVARGAPIGTVGSTGNASPDAPHLHFAIMQTQPGAKWWEPAAAINPYPLLVRR